MCDFWETVLFRAGLYHGNALVVDRELNDRHASCSNHFARWLALWSATVDENVPGTRCRTREAPGCQNRQIDAPSPEWHRLDRTRRFGAALTSVDRPPRGLVLPRSSVRRPGLSRSTQYEMARPPTIRVTCSREDGADIDDQSPRRRFPRPLIRSARSGHPRTGCNSSHDDERSLP